MVIKRTVGISANSEAPEEIMKVIACTNCNITIGKGSIEILLFRGDRFIGKACSYHCSRELRRKLDEQKAVQQ